MQKNVLITGVLGGIGSALAKAFMNQNYYVYGLDRKDDHGQTCNRFIKFD